MYDINQKTQKWGRYLDDGEKAMNRNAPAFHDFRNVLKAVKVRMPVRIPPTVGDLLFRRPAHYTEFGVDVLLDLAQLREAIAGFDAQEWVCDFVLCRRMGGQIRAINIHIGLNFQYPQEVDVVDGIVRYRVWGTPDPNGLPGDFDRLTAQDLRCSINVYRKDKYWSPTLGVTAFEYAPEYWDVTFNAPTTKQSFLSSALAQIVSGKKVGRA